MGDSCRNLSINTTEGPLLAAQSHGRKATQGTAASHSGSLSDLTDFLKEPRKIPIVLEI